MEKTVLRTSRLFDSGAFSCLTLLGCTFITLSSYVKIPFYPVSFTMQTFAVLLLALMQSPRLAFASACCYLTCALVGLPVLCGHSNPLWFLGKSGGYLIAFPIAAYLGSKLSKKCPKILALLVSQSVIYLLGMFWLIPLFGIKIALTKGVLFFIPSDLLKILLAMSVASLWHRRKTCVQ